MPIDRSTYQIDIKSTADTAALKETKQGLKDVGEAAKEGGESFKILGHGTHEAHAVLHALNQAFPGLSQFARFLTSGFTAAVGGALVLFEWLKGKVEAVSKALDTLNTGPGARGEWAEKITENVRSAAVEAATFNERLRELATAQETLSKTTDDLIARQHSQAAAGKAVADAQKELKLAQLELAEKLGQISPEQAVKIRLELDDQAFKAQLEAEKAAIQAELTARQHEFSANEDREPQLRGAKERADAAALAATNAQSKNQAKVDQEKKDLADLQEAQKQMNEGIGLKDIMPHWIAKHAADSSMVGILEGGPAQIDNMIAQKKRLLGQDEAKETPLASAAAVAKEQAAKAKADYEEAAKSSEEILHTVQKLQGDLAAATAKNAALENIHQQTSATHAAAANADIANRVMAGGGTPGERAQVVEWQSQAGWAGTPGSEVGIDINQGKAALQMAKAGVYSGHGDPAALHELLNEFIGLAQNIHATAAQKHDLTDLQRQVNDLNTRINIGRQTY